MPLVPRLTSPAFLLFLTIAVLPARAWPQALTNANGWYMYFGSHAFSDRWGAHLEGQYRRSDVLLGWQQLLLRSGINYRLNRRVTLRPGYAYVRSYAYGEVPGRPTREHRLYQDALVQHRLGTPDAEHRFRLEQRFIAPTMIAPGQDTNWEYRNRARYRLQVRVPFRAPSVNEAKLYLCLYNELFAAFGAHGGSQWLDQNRAYGALGINLNDRHRLEIGYQLQYVSRGPTLYERNHTLQVALFSQQPFRRRTAPPSDVARPTGL